MQKLLTTVSIHHRFYFLGLLLLFYLLTIQEILPDMRVFRGSARIRGWHGRFCLKNIFTGTA